MAYVLIVDDDADFAGSVSTVLKSRGHETAAETDADKAIDRIRQRRPEVVILDVMFPESGAAGFDVARAIRRNFGDLPVVLLTAANNTFPLGFSNKDRDGDWLPVAEFMEKPVDLNRLCDKIDKLLVKYKAILASGEKRLVGEQAF
ncbi:MAG: response regulator [Thermoguttaceae bacterium]|jgi:two-component system nitrogen regulation response regulator NtrX